MASSSLGTGQEALGPGRGGAGAWARRRWARRVWRRWGLGEELLVLGDGDVQELLGDAPGARGRWARLGGGRYAWGRIEGLVPWSRGVPGAMVSVGAWW